MRSSKISPNQTKPNQTKPNQTKPNQTKPMNKTAQQLAQEANIRLRHYRTLRTAGEMLVAAFLGAIAGAGLLWFATTQP